MAEPFNPIETAKQVIGELTDAITATPRNEAVPEPQGRATFNTALLLQAGLRILMPVEEREGVALPKIFPNDPPELQFAQNTYADVFKSGCEASEKQRVIGILSLQKAAENLAAQGFEAYASTVTAWLDTQELFAPVHPDPQNSLTRHRTPNP
jgi:hypothetical protein